MKSEWEQKIWGKTRCVEHDEGKYSKHELQVEKGGFCSVHWHSNKLNKFILKSGQVRIVWSYAWAIHWCDLELDSEFVMPSKIPHQF